MEPSVFRSLVESAGDLIFRIDLRGRIAYANPAARTLLGYDPEELIGRSALTYVAPEGRLEASVHYERQIAERRGTSLLESPVVAQSGEVLWLGQHIRLLERDGRPYALDVVGRDNSEHRRLKELQLGQKCLLELTARGKPLFEVLDTLIFFIEAQMIGSAAALAVLDGNGHLLRPIVAPSLPDDLAHAVEAVWEERLPIPEELGLHPKERLVLTDLVKERRWRTRIALKPGSAHRLCWTMPIVSKERRPAGIIAVFHEQETPPGEADLRLLDMAAHIAGIAIERERMERHVRIELKRQVAERTLELEQSNRQLRHEITERLEAERALIRSQALLQEAERIAHLGSWSWLPPNGKMIWSDEAYRIFGVDPAGFAPTLRNMARLVHPEDRRRIWNLRRNDLSSPTKLDFRIIRPDGEERFIQAEAGQRSDEDGTTRLVGVLHDVTERRTLERELLRAGETERKRVGRDLHDGLGQLLTGIGFLSKTLSESLEMRQVAEADEAAEITNLVENAIDHTRSLSKLLLPVELEENGLEAALQRLRSHVEGVYGIACALKTSGYHPIQDAETALHMYRIAQEAVHNAVRHGKPSAVKISLSTNGDSTRLVVTDNGIGLPSDAPSRGSGLGLRTMQYRAQTLGAVLTISRRSAGGTVVRCDLPIRRETEDVVPQEPS